MPAFRRYAAKTANIALDICAKPSYTRGELHEMNYAKQGLPAPSNLRP
jgi:hypothetical protein